MAIGSTIKRSHVPATVRDNLQVSKSTLFSGVNCTKDDLPDIETARADVKYGNWYIEDQKQQGEWDGTASMYDMTIRWTNKHVVIVKIVFFHSATTVTRLARTSRKTTGLFYTLTTSNALRQNLGIQLRSHTPVNVIHLSILLEWIIVFLQGLTASTLPHRHPSTISNCTAGSQLTRPLINFRLQTSDRSQTTPR